MQKTLIKERVCFNELTEESWTATHEEALDAFIHNEDNTLLVAYMDVVNGLTLETRIPVVQCEELVYFIKASQGPEPTPENFLDTVQYGNISTGHIQSLLRMMNGVYAPIFFDNQTWPDSIKNDFLAQLHRFLASLTDTRWKIDRKTVLYVPSEGLSMEIEDAAKNKELVQRLESTHEFPQRTSFYALPRIHVHVR